MAGKGGDMCAARSLARSERRADLNTAAAIISYPEVIRAKLAAPSL